MIWKNAKHAAREWAGGLSTTALYDAVKTGHLKAARVGASGRRLMFCEVWTTEWLVASSTRRPVRPSKAKDPAA